MNNCPLCGERLRWWDRAEPTKCDGCGATIEPPKLDAYRMTRAERKRYTDGTW